MKKFIAIVCLICIVGCTANQRAKQFGGTMKVDVPENQKVVTATWKMDSLWILTRKMATNEVAEEYSFKESSSYGIFEGEVIIKEFKSVDRSVKDE